jgi:putative nucleotidyltransferase with HDIG domain
VGGRAVCTSLRDAPVKQITKVISDILLTLDKYDSQQCLTNICQNIIDFLGADCSVLYLIDRSEDEVYVAAALGKNAVRMEHVREKIGKGVAGWIALHKKPLVLTDTCSDGRCEEEYAVACEKGEKIVSMVAKPLVAFDNMIGVLEVGNYGGRRFTEADVTLLQPLVNIAALAVPKETDEAFARLAEVCVRFLEEKDRYTHGHSLRVMKYSMLIADEILLPGAKKEELRLCALLHDIGKVIIRDSLLSKAGPLTKLEMQTIKMHPTIGFNIVERISRNLSRKILSHHERYDGTGYPEGLKGDQIPLLARIIAIADTFDAITTERPYRGAADIEYAVKEIATCSGTQFDPILVDAFLQAHKRGGITLIKV